jgi:Na+/melibiose symporter-like transporter
MTIFIVALVMAWAMMIAAFYSLYREDRGAMFHRLRDAKRGHFASLNRS